MRIEIHMVQNHSPANLNRDDLGAPKSCWFGGVLRSRISSQCLKRSIRMSPYFEQLRGGIRTRRLAELIDPRHADEIRQILEACGFKPRKAAKGRDDENEGAEAQAAPGESRMLVFTTWEAVEEMRQLVAKKAPHLGRKPVQEQLAAEFAKIIAERTLAPDMALCGRMLEPSTDGSAKGDAPEKSEAPAKKIWAKHETTVEAALQAAHAISTHQARFEVDYYVAADDRPGPDAGAGYVDEAQFASACFYKYFSICWDTLKSNLSAAGESAERLAAHTVGAFLKAAALTTPTGKQNSFAAHNPPDAILVELRDFPISYANAFAKPVEAEQRDLIAQSVAQLAQYVHDIDVGFGRPIRRLWFSPNLRHRLEADGQSLADQDSENLNGLVEALVQSLGFDWSEVQRAVVRTAEG